jgi:hypothetical protein
MSAELCDKIDQFFSGALKIYLQSYMIIKIMKYMCKLKIRT